MAKAETVDYRFVVKECAEGHPFLYLEWASGRIATLEQAHVSLRLRPDLSYEMRKRCRAN